MSYSLIKTYNHNIPFFIIPAGADYTDTSVTLLFDATIVTQMAVVSIFDDNMVEDTEFINLALTSVDNAVIFNPVTARINVEDVDSKLRLCHYYFKTSMH